MSYQVKPGSLAGRLGSGIGKGLAEQLPQEMERGRLAQGLQQFSKKYPQSPLIQQYANLLSIPGVKESPQLLQTFGELARLDRRQQAYARHGQQEPGQPQPSGEVIPQTPGATQETFDESSMRTTPKGQYQESITGDEFTGSSPYRKELEENVPWTSEQALRS